MDELKVIIEQKNGVISFENFDELREQLNNYLEQYRGAAFTEESRVFAKTVVSELRKLKKAVNDRKIEVKKAFMQPYEEFDSKTKELMALIDGPIELIDSQVKVFEKKRAEERKRLIRDIYEEKAGELAGYGPLEKIYSAKWENASTSRKKIEEEMEQAFFSIRMDVESLKLMRVDPDVVGFALDKYKKGDTAIESMRKANEFAELMEKRKKAEEEAARKRLEEEEKKRAAEEAAKHVPVQETAREPETGFMRDPVPEPDAGFSLPFVTPATRKATYRIVASEHEIEGLELYMNSIGISFERMD